MATIPTSLALGDAATGALRAVAVERTLATGDVLLREGDASNVFYIVIEGALSVVVDGKNELGRCGAGALLGEISFLDGQPASATVTATASTTVLGIERAAFERLADERPELATALLQALCKTLSARIRRSSDMLDVVSTEPTRDDRRTSLFAVLRSLFLGGDS